MGDISTPATSDWAQEDLNHKRSLSLPSSDIQIQQIDDDGEGDAEAEGEGGKKKEKTEESAPPPAPERETWGSKLSYFLTLVGYAVGFGNIWRFPYQLRENGGLVFFIPYTIMLIFLGIPIFFLELSVGQRRRKGVVYAWAEISPRLGGIGLACGTLCFMVGLYYNTLIAYCLSYFVDSFRYPLPWTNCNTTSKDKALQDECENLVGGRSSKFYWYRGVLDISGDTEHPGNYSWWLFLYLTISWFAIYLILVKGTQSVGMVVYVTALFPYVVLAIFFIANLCIEPAKAWLGAYRLLIPDWKVLYKPITWLKAGSQIFFSLSLAEGCLVVFASYSPARNNCHKDAISISLINCGTSIFAALVVFPMIGALGHRKYDECVEQMAPFFTDSHLLAYSKKHKYDIYFYTEATKWSQVETGQNIIEILYGFGEITAEHTRKNYKEVFDQKVTENVTGFGVGGLIAGTVRKDILSDLRNCSIGLEATASGGGTGFVFQAFTEAVLHMPAPNFWSVLFFLMLLTLGIDSSFGTVEGVIASMVDLTHIRRSVATISVCSVMTVMALLIFPFGWGPYVLDLMDQWAANWTYLLIALLECIAVSWDYGLAQIAYDVRLMTGTKPRVYILLCWKYIAPCIISLLLLGSVIEFIYETVENHGFTYTAFQPTHKDSTDGDVDLFWPPHVLFVGFLLMMACVMWVPLFWVLQNTKYKLLKDQAPAEFPEEELRQERNINVTREEEQFTDTEKKIMGSSSLHSLQSYRDRVTSKSELGDKPVKEKPKESTGLKSKLKSWFAKKT